MLFVACGVGLVIGLVVALFVGAGAVALFVGDDIEATGAGVEGVDGVVVPPNALAVECVEPNCGGVIASTAPSEPRVPTPISIPRFISLSLLY